MIFVQESHSKAAKIANDKTVAKYGDADFECGTEKHDFWIAAYDKAFAAQYKEKA